MGHLPLLLPHICKENPTETSFKVGFPVFQVHPQVTHKVL